MPVPVALDHATPCGSKSAKSHNCVETQSPTDHSNPLTVSSQACHFTSSTVPLYLTTRSNSSHISSHNSEFISDGDEVSISHTRFGLPPFEDITLLIFGYGSILWKQNFEYCAVYDAYIKGYTRVFYQGTADHRGDPENPGRVATILPSSDPEARVYGKAFQLSSDPKAMGRILDQLDVREGGYHCARVTLYEAHAMQCVCNAEDQSEHIPEIPLDINAKQSSSAGGHSGPKEVICLCYIATAANEDYLGEAPMKEMATQILTSHGLSGPNREYLFLLTECLREMGAEDPHVYELDACARQLLEEHDEEALVLLRGNYTMKNLQRT